jgi:glycosyltransferase involved in cell wall biosynthesis
VAQFKDILLQTEELDEANAMVAAVLLSTYNGERYLNDLLDSIKGQCFRSFDLYVRDDGSTDETPHLIEAFTDANIREFVKGRNIGVVRSFFELLEMAGDKYDYYAFCDQDDVWLKDKLSNAVELLNGRNADLPLLYFSRYELVSSELCHIKYSRIPKKIGFGNAIVQSIVTGCTAVINRKARAVILKKNPVKVHMHDWWFYLVVSAFGEVIYDRRAAIKYRMHEGNVIGAATSLLDEYKTKFKRSFSEKKIGALSLLCQAEEFFSLYAGELKQADEKLLKKVLDGKLSLIGRVGLALSGKIWRQNLQDDLILRISFLLNRY